MNALSHTTDPDTSRPELVVPTLLEWDSAYPEFRAALKVLYASKTAEWHNDSQLCKAKDLPRTQFSRVMLGGEKPSERILLVLVDLFPEVYKRVAEPWIRRKQMQEELRSSAVTPEFYTRQLTLLFEEQKAIIAQQRALIDILVRNLDAQ